ncbi:MAG: BlaI/MecI/CopY family transcriptional regulator [Calditrichaeota bacterium]|nr:BlaI/MecI/CopY family transcriptional regulator [Calditrichota bacterium]MCB9087252.1 BlaI/MecI/CopY family transcriptional regulator [Calditrichia bacterium]
MKKDRSLSELQMEIMRVLWDSGEATVAEVQTALQEQNRELAPTTVATMLSRLEKRSLITHRTENRQYVYRALVSERDVRRSMVRDLIGQLFQGDVKALVSHLVRESEIDATDLNELKKMIAEKEEKAK